VEGSLVAGVSIRGNSGVKERVKVINNIIRHCGTASGSAADAKIAIALSAEHSQVQGNLIYESGATYTIYADVDHIEIDNNHVVAETLVVNTGRPFYLNTVDDFSFRGNSFKGASYILPGLANLCTNGTVEATRMACPNIVGMPFAMISCDITILDNRWGGVVQNQGNSGVMLATQYKYQVAWNGTLAPDITVMGDAGIVELHGNSGTSGPTVIFVAGTRDTVAEIEEQINLQVSLSTMPVGTGVVHLVGGVGPSGTTKLFGYVQPLDSSGLFIATNAAALNGMKALVSVSLQCQQ
jgi:hypothetical protein